MVPKKPAQERNHTFDFLRLLFAVWVLLSHAPELMDGNRSRELFTRLTHSRLSFGEVGLDGFFLLSGYLIVLSWQSSPDFFNFFRKRALRIVPAYVVAFFLSTVAVGLLAPGVPKFFSNLPRFYVASVLLLGSPYTPPVFPGMAHAAVNGPMWTIAYEFRCYFVVALFGVVGLLRSRVPWVTLAVVLLASFAVMPVHYLGIAFKYQRYVGTPPQSLRLFAAFFVGGSYYLLRRHIQYRPAIAITAAFALMLLLPVTQLAEPAVILLGGYLMFYLGEVAFASGGWLRRLPDISYGIYLYGWPVESLWIWYLKGSPWLAFLGSLVLCSGLAWLSWHFVESPMLALKRKRTALNAEPVLA